ncbi:hypothetical protein ACOME3_002961 [Neoechinorhynchus agilis]
MSTPEKRKHGNRTSTNTGPPPKVRAVQPTYDETLCAMERILNSYKRVIDGDGNDLSNFVSLFPKIPLVPDSMIGLSPNLCDLFDRPPIAKPLNRIPESRFRVFILDDDMKLPERMRVFKSILRQWTLLRSIERRAERYDIMPIIHPRRAVAPYDIHLINPIHARWKAFKTLTQAVDHMNEFNTDHESIDVHAFSFESVAGGGRRIFIVTSYNDLYHFYK